MKSRIAMPKLVATKVFKPELDKGERNPYTTGNEIGNPYMKDVEIKIEIDDYNAVLQLLKSKGYDTSYMEIKED